jgi:glycosyltransferase involved in cell wall biosynthesis
LLPRPGRPPYILDVIPNGIDTNFWSPGTSSRNIDVTWCARTDPEKGIAAAMALVPLLCSAGMEYMIVTSERDGPQDELKRLTLEWPTLHHCAALSPKELRGVFRHSKIFLSTSKVEGMPATPLEAAACGCHPYVPAIDGLVDVFESEAQHAFLYSPDMPPDHLAYRLCQLVKHPEIDDRQPDGAPSEAEGNHYARLAAERYSADNMVRRYLSVYDKLLDTPL